MFGSYLCGGDCIEDVMDIKPFWNKRESIRVCSSDVILRTLRNLSCGNVSYESDRKKSYASNVNGKMNSLLLKCLAVTGRLLHRSRHSRRPDRGRREPRHRTHLKKSLFRELRRRP